MDRHDHRLTDHVGLAQARPNYCAEHANSYVYTAMSMVVVLVSSEQVVKPRSRQAVVKPEVLHL